MVLHKCINESRDLTQSYFLPCHLSFIDVKNTDSQIKIMHYFKSL